MRHKIEEIRRFQGREPEGRKRSSGNGGRERGSEESSFKSCFYPPHQNSLFFPVEPIVKFHKQFPLRILPPFLLPPRFHKHRINLTAEESKKSDLLRKMSGGGRILPIFAKYFLLSSFLESLLLVSFLSILEKYHRVIDKPIVWAHYKDMSKVKENKAYTDKLKVKKEERWTQTRRNRFSLGPAS